MMKSPYQNAIATGPRGFNDYSKWTFTFDSYYSVIREGVNEITSKITCQSDGDEKGISPTSYDKKIVIATILKKRNNNYDWTKSKPQATIINKGSLSIFLFSGFK